MKINELFEDKTNQQVPGVVPGDKISEVPPGARPTGDYPTPITQGPPKTSNTPKTNSPTGFTPASASTQPAPNDITNTSANPTTQPEQPEQNDGAESQDDMAKELQSLKMMIRQMQGQLTPPPPPPN